MQGDRGCDPEHDARRANPASTSCKVTHALSASRRGPRPERVRSRSAPGRGTSRARARRRGSRSAAICQAPISAATQQAPARAAHRPSCPAFMPPLQRLERPLAGRDELRAADRPRSRQVASATRRVDRRRDPAGPRGEQRDPVGDEERLLDVVGDEHRRPPLAREVSTSQLLQLAPGDRVERGERLVEEQHRIAGEQRPGEGDPLAHPARELAGVGAGEPREAEALEHRRRARPRAPRASSPRARSATPRCRRPSATAGAGRCCGIQAQRPGRAPGRRVAADADRGRRGPRARRSARAASTCRIPTGRRARRPRPRDLEVEPASASTAPKRGAARDLDRRRRRGRGGRRRSFWERVPVDDVFPSRALPHRFGGSAPGGGSGGAISARCPRAPLDAGDQSPSGRAGRIRPATTSTNCSRCLVVQHSNASVAGS